MASSEEVPAIDEGAAYRTLRERDIVNKFSHDLFRAATVDMCHEFAMLLNKVGEENTTAHPHMSEREALDMVRDAMERIISMPNGARREWIKLAATALGHVVAIDIRAGHISPALPRVDPR